MIWRTIGKYQYEYNKRRSGYTSWYRCVGGRLRNGLWPEWNGMTNKDRYG